MGKRGAAKPKAAGPASSAKRAKTTGPPPPAAPSSWGRPQPPGDVEASALRFFLVDIEDGPSGTDGLEVRLYGVTAEGVSVCARVHGLRPYFYVRCSPDTHGREEDLRAALEAALPAPLIETTQLQEGCLATLRECSRWKKFAEPLFSYFSPKTTSCGSL